MKRGVRAPRFAGRTPSALGSGREEIQGARGAAALRACPWAIAALMLLCIVCAATRARLGADVPWPQSRALRVFDSVGIGASSTWASARLVGEPRGWAETLCALPVLLGEWAQRLDPGRVGARLAAVALAALWISLLLWWAAARVRGWRRPSLGLGALLLAQGFGAALWLGTFRAPIRSIQPASTCRAFDFGARTRRSGGSLSPAQSVAWHRARGFSGLAFADASPLPNPELESLRRANPDMILLNGSQQPGAPRVLSDGAHTLVIEPLIEPRNLQQNPRGASESAQAIEAWSGDAGDGEAAAQARARGVPVVGSAGDGTGSDCFVWSLIPSGARSPGDVIGAVKSRRVAVAHALLNEESSQKEAAARQDLQAANSVSGLVLKPWRQAMSRLSGAQRLNVWLQVLAAILCAVAWGARAAEAPEAPAGPQTVRRFVQRRRLLRRANGLAAMALAFAGSAWAAAFLWAHPALPVAWAAADALYLYGRAIWKRVL